MFWIKKLIAALTSPLTLLLLILVTGLLLACRGRGGLWPRRIIVSATLGLLVVCCGPTGELLLRPLENHHAPIVNTDGLDNITHIVVLGGGYTSRSSGPLTSELAQSSTIRLTEGIRLHQLLDDTTLVLTGASIGQTGSTAEAMAQLAIELGVPEDEVTYSNTPRDTAEEAIAVREMLEDGDRVLVVTSASHIPRAMLLFDRLQLDAVAAPTNHLTSERLLRSGTFVPTAHKVRIFERAVYEYMALIWISIGGS